MEVELLEVAARPTAVVASTTTWPDFGRVWRESSDEVWACLRSAGITSGCRNVMLYLDDQPRVEIGVELSVPCELTGRVVASVLPAGRVARTVHWGSYDGLGAAHDAVHLWARENGHQLSRVRWEVYGPHRDDPAEVWVEVSWQLA